MSTALARLREERWWLTRVAVLPLHMFMFAIAVFFLVRLIPGDPARQAAGPDASEETYLQIREEMGFGGSIITQLGDYVSGLLRLDLGDSLLTGRPVFGEVMQRLPGTIELALIAFVALVATCLLLSFVVLLWPTSMLGRLIKGYAQLAGAVPEFVTGVAGIFVFYATFHLIPAPNGRVGPGLLEPDPITHLPLLDAIIGGEAAVAVSMINRLVLPIAVLVVSIAPLLLKQLLSALRDSSEAAPTLFRVATGAPRRVVYLSVYRRALPPTVALMGSVFGTLLGGAVILESLFALGGLGTYAVTAVDGTDLVALQGCLVVVAAISMIVFLLVDLTNMSLDPRRRPGVQGAP